MLLTKLDEQTLATLNPCLTAKAFSQYRHKPLPRNYEIRVPVDRAAEIKTALKKRPNRSVATRR